MTTRPPRHFPHRPRLLLAALVGALAGFFLPAGWSSLTAVLAAWNIGVWAYLLSISWLLARADQDKVRQLAEQEDNGAAAVLAIMSLAAVLSIAAIVVMLASARNEEATGRMVHYAITFATVVGSWLLVGVLFTIHYARMYYREPANARPLRFPDHERQPDYWDFLYFSFTIAVAVQTSDIAIHTRDMRRVVLAQSVLSFFFNAAVLGLSVNIAATVLGR